MEFSVYIINIYLELNDDNIKVIGIGSLDVSIIIFQN